MQNCRKGKKEQQKKRENFSHILIHFNKVSSEKKVIFFEKKLPSVKALPSKI